MKFYNGLKKMASDSMKVAAVTLVTLLPYVCESCSYSNNKAEASEMRQIKKAELNQANLEILIKE